MKMFGVGLKNRFQALYAPKLALVASIAALTVLSVASGCSTVNVRIPKGRADSPVVQGTTISKPKVLVHAGTQTGVAMSHDVRYDQFSGALNVSGAEPTPDILGSIGGNNLHVGADLGVAERFDVGLKIHGGGNVMLNLKGQIVGPTYAEDSTGNFVMGVNLGLGGQHTTETTHYSYGFLTYSADSVKMRMTTGIVDASLSFGYRLDPKVTLYVAPYAQMAATRFRLADNEGRFASSDLGTRKSYMTGLSLGGELFIDQFFFRANLSPEYAVGEGGRGNFLVHGALSAGVSF